MVITQTIHFQFPQYFKLRSTIKILNICILHEDEEKPTPKLAVIRKYKTDDFLHGRKTETTFVMKRLMVAIFWKLYMKGGPAASLADSIRETNEISGITKIPPFKPSKFFYCHFFRISY